MDEFLHVNLNPGVCPDDEPVSDEQALQAFWQERERLRGELGWSTEHDDTYTGGELAKAAAAYALAYAAMTSRSRQEAKQLLLQAWGLWPFDDPPFEPCPDHSTGIKAAALLMAEWQRLAREATKNTE